MEHINIAFGVREIMEDTVEIDPSTLRTMGLLLSYISEQVEENGDCVEDLGFMSEFLLIDEKELIGTLQALKTMKFIESETEEDGTTYLYTDVEEVAELRSQGYLNRGVYWYS